MTEPPIHVRPDGVEAEPPRTGHRWLDLVLAGSAILISVVSLFIGVANARIQQKMVAAASWPLLFLDSGNRDEKTNTDVIAIAVRNDGAGPAIVKSVTAIYKGKRYSQAYPLLMDCCGWRYVATKEDAKTFLVTTARLNRSVIPNGGERLVLMVPLTDVNREIWMRLDKERFNFKFDACYCSVLGECWRSDLQGGEPRPVKQCPATEGFSR
jgi:hypothetical protein